jgi:hypothetical protein
MACVFSLNGEEWSGDHVIKKLLIYKSGFLMVLDHRSLAF